MLLYTISGESVDMFEENNEIILMIRKEYVKEKGKKVLLLEIIERDTY